MGLDPIPSPISTPLTTVDTTAPPETPAPVQGPQTQAQALHSAFKEALTSGKTGQDLDRALAQVMGGHDMKTGVSDGIRNVMTQDHCESILMTIDTSKNLDESGLRDLMNGRQYMAVVHGEGDTAQITIIRNDDPGLKGTGSFSVSRGGGDFQNLDMTSTAQTVFQGGTDRLVLSTNDGISHVHSGETKGKVDGPFYHEEQTGGQCGIHSMNAMLGFRAVVPSELTAFNDIQMVQSGIITKDGIYDENANISDAASGNDPAMMVRYLHQLAGDGLIDNSFSNARLDSVNVDDSLLKNLDDFQGDRLIIGRSNPAHFVAFRRDTNNEWHLVDSMKGDQQKISPSDYLKTEGLGYVHIIHTESSMAPPPKVEPPIDPRQLV